jgi:large subunit ribosomal protein L29
MKFNELTAKSKEELRTLLLDLKKQMAELSVKLKMNQEKQNHKLRVLKKDIARIMTILQH